MKKRPNINKTFSIGTNNSHVNRKTPWTRTLVLSLLLAVPILLGTPNAAAADDGAEPALLVTGDWGLNEFELPMLHDGEKFDENFQVQLATDPGAETTVQLTLSNQFKNDKVDKPKIELDKAQLIFTSENWNLPQSVLVDHLEAGWEGDPAFITLTVNGSGTTITLLHVHDDEWAEIVTAREERAGDTGDDSTDEDADDGAEPALLVNGDTKKLKLEIVPGSEDDFQVQLATDPGEGTTVVLDVTSKKREQVTVDQTQLTFTGGPDGDWDKSRPVKVTTDETHHQKVDIKVTVNEDASNSDAYRGLHKKGEIKVEVKVGEAPESTDDDGEAPTEDSTDDGAEPALLVTGDWGLNEFELPMLHD
ncbi:MAG: hypothetical protein VX410_06455, partial [Actinomycetota bacterium]|nr:hypothetical protein [Actinomycetota bacterium]